MISSSHTVVAARFGVLISIDRPGWNEYEEEVNCSPQNEAEPKGEGEIQPDRCVISFITALVLLKSLKTYDKFEVILDRYINT